MRRPFRRDRLHHLSQKPCPLLDAAAVVVGAEVGLRLQELVDEVAVGGVNLDAVKPGGPRPGGSPAVVGHDGGDLPGLEGSGRLVGFLAERRVDAVAVDLHGRSRHRRAAAVEVAVRGAAHVPELEEDASARRMHRRRDDLPARLHRVGIDAGRFEPAVGLLRDRGGLGDDQPRGGPLDVVLRHGRIRNPFLAGAAARERRHHDPVGQREVAE